MLSRAGAPSMTCAVGRVKDWQSDHFRSTHLPCCLVPASLVLLLGKYVLQCPLIVSNTLFITEFVYMYESS